MNKKDFPPIERQKGWGVFLLGLGISLILGLTIQSIFSPRTLQNWVQSHLVNNGWSDRIEIKGIELDLSRSTFPRWAFKVEELVYQQSGRCSPYRVFLQDVYLPFKWLSLLDGKLSLSTVQVGQGEFHVRQPCQEEKSHEDSVASSLSDSESVTGIVKTEGERRVSEKRVLEVLKDTQKGLVELQDYFKKRWEGDWEKGRTFLSGIELRKFSVFDGKTQKRWLTFPKFHIQFISERRLRLESRIQVDEQLFSRTVTRPINVSLEVHPERLRVKANGLFQEGRIQVEWMLPWNGEDQHLSFKTIDFPLRVLSSGIQSVWDESVPLDFRRLWLSCRWILKGPVQRLASSPLEIKKCEMYGNGGKVATEALRIHNTDGVINVDPFQVDFDGFSVGHFINIVGLDSPTGIFNDLGRIYGSFKVGSLQEMSGVLDVKDMELSFSNHGVHGRQKIEQVRLELDYSRQRFSGLISRIQLDDGSFSGTLSFNLDSGFKSGVAQVKVKELSLNPSIQKLLVDGNMSAMELYGKAKISEGAIEQWKGTLGAQEIVGASWGLKDFKLNSEWHRETIFGDIRAESLYFKKGSRFLPISRALLLNKDISNGESRWQKLSAKMELNAKEGKWKDLKVTYENSPKTRILSHGAWKRDSEMLGVISVHSPLLPKLDWTVVGDIKSIQVFPSAASIRKILVASKKNRLQDSIVSEKWFEEMVEESRLRDDTTKPVRKTAEPDTTPSSSVLKK
ncbi:MAG: hypothetical protein KDD61_13960 [Bdellovibrionales bacterium]|nr:hypothetical protein [Bdellovibrionales bacterium]